ALVASAPAGRPGDVPVRDVRVRLSAHRDPAVHFPVVAQGNADVAGHPVRAQVHAATAWEAIAALQARLGDQIDRARRAAESWQPAAPPSPRVAWFPRPPAARQIVRYKPWQLALLGVDDAVAEMERRDYGFYLFTEAGNGQDSVVYRCGPTGYRLAQVLPAPQRLARYTVPLTCYDRPAPELRTVEAAELLGMSEVPFLFFRDTASGRGRVLYRRYDGHYGLICPGESPSRGAR
ncbi:MAG TPA: sigma 54 modulation/S30EA ribosomal C-terminal domain-containing protein, partial [Pseudonocardiaceae bacterium]|nr:sigma 54 modulation/S30EA ribosomal C-terminal domain-containing protein [Pseudonocardiaceae bacterium]